MGEREGRNALSANQLGCQQYLEIPQLKPERVSTYTTRLLESILRFTPC